MHTLSVCSRISPFTPTRSEVLAGGWNVLASGFRLGDKGEALVPWEVGVLGIPLTQVSRSAANGSVVLAVALRAARL